MVIFIQLILPAKSLIQTSLEDNLDAIYCTKFGVLKNTESGRSIIAGESRLCALWFCPEKVDH